MSTLKLGQSIECALYGMLPGYRSRNVVRHTRILLRGQRSVTDRNHLISPIPKAITQFIDFFRANFRA